MKITIFLLAVILSLSLLPNSTIAKTRTGDYSLFIPDSKELYKQSMRVLVAGIEHNLTFHKPSDNITVIMYSNGYFSGGIKNESTYYRWRYLNGDFDDLKYGKYINKSSSAVFGDKIAFHIGIYSRAEGTGKGENGTWHLKVKSGENTIIEDNILVENVNASLGLSTPVFEFRVEPSFGGIVGPTVKDYKFRTVNTGNVPLLLTASYDKMGNIFETTNMGIVLKPEDEVYHHINITARPWSPQIFSVTGHIKGTPLHVMNTEGMTFISSPVGQVHISVKVVRQGFDIIDIGPAKLQYEQGPQVAEYNEVRILRCFLNGNGSARLTISPSELLIKGVYYNGMWHNETTGYSPINLNFSLEKNIEKEVRITVKCYKEKVSARLTYRIEEGNKSGSAHTDIVVGEAPAIITKDEGEGFWISPVGIAIAIGFFALIAEFITLITLKDRRSRESENDKNNDRYRPEHKRKKRKKK